MFLPQARIDGLNVQELPNETLVYDLKISKAHSLNRVAALVWRRCDGLTTPAEIAVAVGRELDRPIDESVVRLGLEQLSRRKLLLAPVAPAPEAVRLKRRAFLKGLVKVGAVAAVVPVIMTITAPKAAAAASASINTNPFANTSNCINEAVCGAGGCGTGVCVPTTPAPAGSPVGTPNGFPGICSCV